LSYRQIADATKLSARVVEALETCRFAVLPAGIYRRAIVKAVAIEVGLDPERLLTEFATAFPNDLPSPDLPHLAERAARPFRTWPRVLMRLGIVAPVVGIIGYLSWPPRTAPLAPLPSKSLSARSAEVIPAGGFGEIAASEPRVLTLTLTISSRCRLRILSDGRELLSRLVEGGESIPIELGDEIVMTGDNASAVQFSINGRAGRQLGQPGDTLSVRIGRDDYQTFLARY
jgi:hypothetical protein